MSLQMIDRVALERVVATANGKGGVGKTSVTANTAGLAAASGHRCLVIDLDPQGNLGDDLGYNISGASDAGEHLVISLMTRTALRPVLREARPNLDVICGGERLSDLAGALQSRVSRGQNTNLALAEALTPIAGDYDLIIIDTPPGDVLLQNLALTAARWLIVPTKSDASSITGLQGVARRMLDVREDNPALEVAGVALFDANSTATKVRAEAAEEIEMVLGGAAPLFATAIRSSQKTAKDARKLGKLVYELPQIGVTEALTEDYAAVVAELLGRIAEGEKARRDSEEALA